MADSATTRHQRWTLLRRAEPAPLAPTERRAAVIDIGSNSLRLVVYVGPPRAPIPLFNEKLSIGLGSELATTGMIPQRAFDRAIVALARFQTLTQAMGVSDVRCVATAAVRDASNGDAFIAAAAAIGISIELLSGGDEARIAGLGVLSAMPKADGIVADLGGGSLELVRVRNGQPGRGTSFPLGVLRVAALRGKRGFAAKVRAMLSEAGWPEHDGNLPLYLVGGSWRALARYEMHLAHDPLPVVSGHRIPLASVPMLKRSLVAINPLHLATLPGISSARSTALADAAALLDPLCSELASSELIVCTSGLREGLLFDRLDLAVRAQDPLIAAAEAEGRRFARFEPHGATLDRWIAPLFTDDDAAAQRLRLAACLMAEAGWTANPDFRAERAAEMVLHGPWLGIDLADRLVLAQTLWSAAGGPGDAVKERPRGLGVADRLVRATQWGLAIRLGERLSGGAPGAFAMSRLSRDNSAIDLALSAAGCALAGEQVEKRLRQLADALECAWRLHCDA